MQLEGTAYHPDFGALVNYKAVPLSTDPDRQVAQTIDFMRQNVRRDAFSEPIQRDSTTMDSGSGDDCADAFHFTKPKVRFQSDEKTAAPFRNFFDDNVVEVLISPRDLANMDRPVEDCDGFAQYAAALLRARGVKCNFVTVAVDPREPNRFSHVYLACYPNGQRIALDTSHGPFPGWEAPNMFGKKKEWPIDGPDWGELLFLAALLFGGWLLAKSLGVPL